LKCPKGPEDDLIRPKDQDANVTDALICLCMLVVMQDTSYIKLYKSPMMHYLAVRGVDKQSETLQLAFFYMLILASAL
jgi:hypothetical protein